MGNASGEGQSIMLYTLYTPFIPLHYHIYAYVHPFTHVYTPYIHLFIHYIYTIYTPNTPLNTLYTPYQRRFLASQKDLPPRRQQPLPAPPNEHVRMDEGDEGDEGGSTGTRGGGFMVLLHGLYMGVRWGGVLVHSYLTLSQQLRTDTMSH